MRLMGTRVRHAARPLLRKIPLGPRIGAILLAAGMSRRMPGQNKLLVQWRNQPLVCHAAKTLATTLQDKTVQAAVAVAGQDAAKVTSALAGHGIHTVVNRNYAQGLASSLVCGLDALQAAGDIDAVLVMLGDMPLVTPNDIKVVVAALATAENGLVVPTYAGKRGNPALLGNKHFTALRRLSGDSGARSLFAAEATTEAPAGPGVLFDIDTQQAMSAEPFPSMP